MTLYPVLILGGVVLAIMEHRLIGCLLSAASAAAWFVDWKLA